ncbi:MAG: putative polysaccharide biosynthesis protein [Clostridium sp.]
MREENSTAKGFLILSMAGILAKILSVLYMPLLNAIIGTEGYGMYQNSYLVFIFFYAITSTGTQPAISKIVTELITLDNERDAIKAFKYTRNILAAIGAFISIMLIVFAFPIARLINSDEIAYAIMGLAPCIFFTCILSAYRGYFQGRGSMKAIAISTVVEQVFNIVISLLCAYLLMQVSLPYGVAGGTIGTGLGALVGILCLIHFYNKYSFEEEAFENNAGKKSISNKKILKKLIRYGLPITLSAGVQNLGSLVDMAMVNGRLLAAGFNEKMKYTLVGYSGQYLQFLGVPLIIITSLGQSVLPALSKAMALKDRRDIKKNINYALRMTFIITIPSAIGLMMVRDEMYKLMFGLDAGGSYLMLYGGAAVILMGITQIQAVILQGINEQKVVLKTFLIGIVLKIACSYFLVGIESINILGVIVGNYMLYGIPAVLNARAIRRAMRMKISYVKFIVKPAIAGSLMALGISVTKEFFEIIIRFMGESRFLYIPILIVVIGIGAFIYAYIMVVIAGIRKRDLDAFSPKIYRYLPKFVRKQMQQ